jgi:hypothetical protein
MMRRSIAMGFACVALAACADNTSTPPDTTSTLLQGSYDLTTTLDTFNLTTNAPSPPDCPSATSSGFCVHAYAYAGATLTGTLNFTRRNGGYGVSGHLVGTFCDQYDLTNGCTHASAVDGDYSGIISAVNGPFTGTLGGEQTSIFGPALQLVGTGTGDSLTGVISWSLSNQQNPPTHRGKFVLKKE